MPTDRPMTDAELDAMRSRFDLTPQQYHAGIDLLWAALGVKGVQERNVFELAAAEITKLRAIVAESYETILQSEGFYVKDGERAGWWDSCCMSDAVMAGDELVELGLWERHPDGYGRRWFYRPLDRKARHGCTDANCEICDGGQE